MQGYHTMNLFVEETDIKISAVRSKSKIGAYEAGPVRVVAAG